MVCAIFTSTNAGLLARAKYNSSSAQTAWVRWCPPMEDIWELRLPTLASAGACIPLNTYECGWMDMRRASTDRGHLFGSAVLFFTPSCEDMGWEATACKPVAGFYSQ